MKLLVRVLLIGFLCSQLICTGCVHTSTINKPTYVPFLTQKPISQESLQNIHQQSPKDAVFADLLQAFALMRTKDLNNTSIRREILGLPGPR